MWAATSARTACGCQRVAPRGRPRAARVCYRVHVVRAQQPEEERPTSQADSKKVDEVLQQLKDSGWDKGKAKDALDKWSKLGASTDPEQLRKLLVKSSFRPLQGLLLQTLLDGLASAGGFFIASTIRNTESFFGDFGIEFLGYAAGLYYFLQVVFELFALGTILIATYRFNANPEVYLKAVTELAGPSAGLSVVDKAQRAVNTARVFQVLLEILDLLKDKPQEASTLSNLSAYLTLSRAEKRYGFVPEDYGLSEKQAADIAAVFAQYDTNDDMRIEPSELRAISNSLGKDLDDDELREAVKLLDNDKSGYIEFGEFVAWWVGKKDAGSAQEPTAAI